jgi:hypothetical protein
VRRWDAKTGREGGHFEAQVESTFNLAVSRRGEALALERAKAVRLLGGEGGNLLRSFAVGTGYVWGAALSADLRLLAACDEPAGGGSRLTLWDVAAGRERWRRWEELRSLTGVAFAPGGEFLATSGECVRLWEVSTGKQVGRFEATCNCLAFSPQGSALATSGGDDAVLLWEVSTGKVRRRFAGHHASCLAFSPDGRLLATGGEDTRVMCWDVLGRASQVGAGLDTLWGRLASDDAAVAYDALCEMLSRPGPTVEFVRCRLPTISEAEVKRIDRLVADLDAQDYAVREKATKDLEALGAVAEAALQKTVASKPSAELAKRAGRLLAKYDKPWPANSDLDLRRGLRLVELLEHVGTDGAEALKELAERARWGRVRAEARASLARLATRGVAR